MTNSVAEFYNQSTPTEEVERLKSFQYPDRVSIIEIGDPNGISLIDVGAGPNHNLEEYVKSKGGKYTAMDINLGFLKNRTKDNKDPGVSIQADAKNLPFDGGQGSKRLVHERFLLMNLSKDEDKSAAVKEALRTAGDKGMCLFIDYDWNGFRAEGVMQEFGRLSKELLSSMGVDVNFGMRSQKFIEDVLAQLDIKAKVRSVRHERLNEGNYNEVEGMLKSLSAVCQKSGNEELKNRWEDMKNKLNIEFEKPEGQRAPYTPPAIVAVRIDPV